MSTSALPSHGWTPDRRIQPCAIVPVYQPVEQLLSLIDELLSANFLMMIVVNDGSSPKSLRIFEELKRRKRLIVLEHDSNLGKGDALKTALRYILSKGITTSGAVTFDCDGQHTASDVVKIAQSLMDNPQALSLGVRTFDDKVPIRNRFGNTLMRFLVSLFYKKTLTDTQTGLRAIPSELFSPLAALQSGRFEFEMEMLIFAIARQMEIIEVPIQTIYRQKDYRSHFHPFLDSARISHLFWRSTWQRRLSLGFNIDRENSGNLVVIRRWLVEGIEASKTNAM
ncbi:MAG: hypothetical protein C5B53_00330 [Candidatus Melainabacteria bacterium]|nr:MAG: hypothetical protein C5B53_00330 [Candidatus Melainabacteria bacterium]